MKIKISIGDLHMECELNDSPTSSKLSEILPLKTDFNTWGDEIYFTVPIQSELDGTAVSECEIGDLGYWPTGQAFCIFFGPTPMSREDKPIPASAVNIIGKVLGDPKKFKGVMDQREVLVEAF